MSRRTITKNIRFTPEEFSEIQRKAKELNITTSKYIRTTLAKGKTFKLLVPEYISVMSELSRISNNVNQIACRLNTQGSFYYDDFAQMKDNFENINSMLFKYITPLSKFFEKIK